MFSKDSLRQLSNDALGRRKEHGRRGKHRRLALETQLEVRAMLTPTTHFHADFSDAGGAASLDGFTIDNNIGAAVAGLWHLSTGRGNDPGHSSDDSMYFGTGETSTGGGNYDVGDTAGRITSPSISVPAAAVLSFSYFLQTERFGGVDVPSVLISANSGPFNPQSISLNANSQGFLFASLDLNAFRGQNIQVRFEFDTIDATSNDFEGWYIDDVMVTSGTRSIRGTVFHDANDNVTLDGDAGIPDTQVFIDDNDNGVYDTDYSIFDATNGTQLAIPDNTTVTSNITVFGSPLEMIRDVNVTVDITHAWDSDLDVFLIGPNGTRVELFTDVGDRVANFSSTTLDDEASSSITSGTAPFTGTFRPEAPLAVLDGIALSGTWFLEITDDSSGFTGTLNSWSLQLGLTRVIQNTTSVSVPDLTTMTSPLNVSGTTGYIQDIDVQLDITHAAARDLDIFLIAPNGVRVELATDAASVSGSDFSQTIFDDEAATAIVDGSAPFTGRFRPEGLLSALDGYTANGTWQLEVTDDHLGLGGTLSNWSLALTIGERTDVTDGFGNYDIPVTNVGTTFRVRQATPHGFLPTAPPTGMEIVTVAPEVSTVTGVNFANQRPDIRMISATGNGGTGISFTYEIKNGTVAPFEINIFQSSDELQDIGDQLIGSWLPQPGGLTVGVHTVNLIPGVDFVLPGAGMVDTNIDYRLLFSADSNNVVDEADIDPRNEDNTVAFTGVYRLAGGPVMAFGFDTADTFTVTPNGLNVDFTFGNASMTNPLQTSYPVADVTQFRLRGAGGDDNFTSGASNDTMSIPLAIWGGAGPDTIQGGDGNDSLFGGADNDLYVFFPSANAESDTVEELNGGGRDTLDFSQLATAVTLNLGSTAAQAVHTNRTLTLNSSTGFEDATGGLAGDSLTGNSNDNRLFGFGGPDTLRGGARSDTLLGGQGDDVYVFGPATTAEADVVTELANEGSDSLSFTALTTSISLNLGSIATQGVHSNRTLQLNSGAVIENVVGGAGSDTLIGNSLANSLTGGAGNDTLTGGAGSDILSGGLNDDTYVFRIATTAEADEVIESVNQGNDTLSFSTVTTDVVLNVGLNIVQTIHANRTLKLNSGLVFENIIGGSGNDTLTGNSSANTLTGGAGNDILAGAAGDDVLSGGLNDDNYVFRTATAPEADQVIESTNQGIDTLSFSTVTTDIVLNLVLSSVQAIHANRTLKLNSGLVFESIVGGSANDTLIGNSLDNTLNGGNGHNVIAGVDGADTLIGGTGRDILIGGRGLDTLNGGTNDDILIAGRTSNDTNTTNLNSLRTAWISSDSYSTRIVSLRAGVGSPLVSLKARTNVVNDAGEDDVLTGGTGTDWYFRAVNDAISDLFAGETIDVL